MDDQKTFTLIKSIEFGAIKLAELTLTEPTAGQLEVAARSDTAVGTVISIIQQQTEKPRKLIEKICNRDLKRMSDFLDSFGTASEPNTGAVDSPQE